VFRVLGDADSHTATARDRLRRRTIQRVAALLLLMIVVLSPACHRSNTDLTIPATRLMDAWLSARYSATLTARGGFPPYHWRIAAGHLSKGLKLNMATGEIFGTPAEVGSFAFTVEVTDTSAPKAHRSTQSIALTVVKGMPPQTPMGPLRVSAANPRYFQDANGKIVYLTGSHTWTNFQDIVGPSVLKSINDLGGYSGYLDFLQQHNHNFIRLWMVEHAWDADDGSVYGPMPYLRTGPGTALDGKPKFHLKRFNQAYFNRLRQRVVDARARGIYVSVMLFDDWSTENVGPWKGHPFHRRNNINRINGDPNGDSLGIEVHTLQVPDITAIQEAYVRKVIDTLNDLDNVIWEVANETDASAEWQAHFIDFIHSYESAPTKKQHPVGTTAGNATGTPVNNTWLFGSAADWIAPNNNDDYTGAVGGPPAADGRKVVISDTDHLPPTTDRAAWVWKTFSRGLNPIYMDSLLSGRSEEVRRAMGHARAYAKRIDLIHMVPRGDLASSGYCLANPGREYLIYLPAGGKATVELSGASWTFTAEWFNPDTAEIASGGAVAGGGRRRFEAPLSGRVLLYLVRSADLGWPVSAKAPAD
jgi:Family of unknown function (DUF6298)/Putative Ig domain/Putative collagen-binding domain of a collagenase